MSEGPWFKFYSSDWLGGVGDLTAAERGVYITLLALIYDKDGSISLDAARLARRCGCPKAAFLKALDALVEVGKLSVVDGCVTNKRAKTVLSERENRSEKARASANARWSAREQNSEQKQPPPDASASHTQCEGICDEDANQIPDARSQIEEGGGGSASEREAAGDTADDLTEREQILEAMGLSPSGVTPSGRFVGGQGDMAEVRRWSALGLSHAQQLTAIREAMAGKRDGAPSSFRYFTPIMTRLAGDLSRPDLAPASADQRSSTAAKPRAWSLDPNQFNEDGSRRQ